MVYRTISMLHFCLAEGTNIAPVSNFSDRDNNGANESPEFEYIPLDYEYFNPRAEVVTARVTHLSRILGVEIHERAKGSPLNF